MKKSLYIYLFYCLFGFSDTICATQKNDDQEEEILYIIEVFDKDISKKKYKESDDPSKRTERGFVLIVSSKITWNSFKSIIHQEIDMEIENRFFLPVYSRWGTPTSKEKTVSPEEYTHTFSTLLKNEKPYSREPEFFEEKNFKALQKDSRYRGAKMFFKSQIFRLEESNEINRSVLAWQGGDNFKLMDIDDYHQFKKKGICIPESSPEPNEDLIDSNEDPLELSSEEDTPQLTQDNSPNESSLNLDPQNILVLPVIVGSAWVGHSQLFAEKKKKKKKKKKTPKDDKEPDEIIIQY